MRFDLMPHESCPPGDVRGVSATIDRQGSVISLFFNVDGGRHVRWPAFAEPKRADDLWQATCFELFLRFDDDERYVEFNFSPSTQWATYAFDGYRENMAELPREVAPIIERLEDGVRVDCDLGGLPHGALAMALSAVIEEQDGTKSYWALAHAHGPPDFHHPACFAARLPAPESP